MIKFAKLHNYRVFRFCLTGGAATIVHVSVFTFLVEIFDISAVLASIPSFLSALSVSYAGNRYWTFQSNGSHATQLPKYTIVAVTGLILNILITFTVVDLLGAWYGLSLLLVILIVPTITFWLSRKWVFNTYA